MEQERVAKRIVERFVAAGHTAYFAGGWVRDRLLGHPSHDIDIVTSAPVAVTQTLFAKTIPVGIQFGIVIVVEEGHSFEVALFRKEEGYADGRRPGKIEPANPKEDALRRDFTINGMFYDPLTETIYDYVGGQEDLKNEVIRAIGNPHERFAEDRLRMIRAVRYASRFRFAIDPKTLEAIITHAEELFPAVAIERVWQELHKMPHLDEAIPLLHRLGLFEVIFPMWKGKGEPRIPKLSKQVPTLLHLFELFPNATLQDHLALCDYFKLSNQERQLATDLAAWHQDNDLYTWGYLYAKETAAVCQEIHVLHGASQEEHEKRKLQLQEAIIRIQERRPLVTAAHLLEKGVKAGPEMGRLLKKAEQLAINEGLSTVDAVLHRLF